MRKWSLLRLSRMTIALVALALCAVTAAIFWATSLMRDATSDLVRGSTCMELASAIHLQVLEHQRYANLARVHPTARTRDAANRTKAKAFLLLARGNRQIGSDVERTAYEEVRRTLRDYFRRRAELDSSGAPLDEVLPAIRPQLDEAVDSLASWRAISARRVQVVSEQTYELTLAFRIISIASALLGGLVLWFVAVAIRRQVVAPVVTLERAMSDLRQGKRDSLAPEGGPRELQGVAAAFNAMRDALAREREDRLSFAAGIAHELRSPLSVLRMGIATLQADAGMFESRSSRQVLRRLARQTETMNRLVADLMDASQIEAGTFETSFETVDLAQLAETACAAYADFSDQHDIVFCARRDSVMVLADSVRIEQVIGNLINNAIKYSPNGGAIVVEVGVVDGWASLAVTDEGIGVAPDEIEKLFAPFQRQSRAREVSKGAGLGLSIVRRIVRAHDGDIDVESVPGVRTTFRVRLPLVQNALPRELATAEEGAAISGQSPSRAR